MSKLTLKKDEVSITGECPMGYFYATVLTGQPKRDYNFKGFVKDENQLHHRMAGFSLGSIVFQVEVLWNNLPGGWRYWVR